MSLRSMFVVSFVAVACGGAPPSSTAQGFPDAPYAVLDTDGKSLSFELRTSPSQPPEPGEISVELRVRDGRGAPKDGLAIEVTPFMPSHGHGASVTPTVSALGGGVYRADHVDLFMAGTWQLRLAFACDGTSDHATAEISAR